MRRIANSILIFIALVFFCSVCSAEDSYIYNMRNEAIQGDVSAQYHLGLMYEYGELGLPISLVEAMKWYRKAANQGYARAQWMLGIKYQEGQGVRQNPFEAMKWYKKAADQGFERAQWKFATMYYEGQGVSQNYFEAMKWYKKAADQGLQGAWYMLGTMYHEGQGVPQNYVKAYTYWSMAAVDIEEAKTKLSFLMPKMTPGQIAEGQEQAEILWGNLKKRLSRNKLQIKNNQECSDWDYLTKDPEILASTVSPDEVYRLTVKETGVIELSNNNTGHIKVLYSELNYGCGSLGCRDGQRRAMFTSDGKYAIATSSFRGGPTLIWETKTWTQLQFEGDEFYGGYFSLSQNSQYVALVGYSLKDGPHLFLIDLASRKVTDISKFELPKEIAQNSGLEESYWFDKISNERAKVFYNFNFSKDSKYIIIHKNSNELIRYDIRNKNFSFCRSVDAKENNDLFETLKISVEDRIRRENISEISDVIENCCGFDSKSPEIILAYNLIEEFKKALVGDNRDLVLNFVYYPISINIDNRKKTFYSPSELMGAYDKVFDNELRKFSSELSYGCVGCKGIMMELGGIWFNFDGKIIAINK